MTSLRICSQEDLVGQVAHSGAHFYPNYQQSFEHGDTTGKARTTYVRSRTSDGNCEILFDPVLVHNGFITTYSTDLAGRITSVSRIQSLDPNHPVQEITTYVYNDSRVALAVIETRPDGSRTLVYLDVDGLVRKVAHQNSDESTAGVFEYERDRKGRITQVREEIADSNCLDGYRSDVVEYVYGDGNLTASDLDGGAFDNKKLPFAYLSTLGGGWALRDSDANRLVVERRNNTDADDQGSAITYKREYWYDPGGNRLAMRESLPRENPADDKAVSITRYNYHYSKLENGGSAPGLPHYGSEVLMDYQGKRKNRLVSSLTHFVEDGEIIETTRVVDGRTAA